MEYACENVCLLNEDILCTLLKAAPEEASLAAMEKIQDSAKKESIKQQVFPESFSISYVLSLPSLEPTFSVSLPHLLIVEEEEICRCLIKGDAIQLRHLLESGISPDYMITEDVIIGDFVCKAGFSLLLLVLQACVEKQSFFVVFENIALLLEKQASLVKECLGTTPLFYICEHEDIFLKDVLLCFLTSVDKTIAFSAISKITNSERREYIASILRSRQSVFQFEPDNLEKKEIQRIKEDLLAVTDIFVVEPFEQSGLVQQPLLEKGFGSEKKANLSSASSVSLTSDNTLPSPELSTSASKQTLISGKSADKEESIAFSISSFFKNLTNIIVNVEDFSSRSASCRYGDRVNKLLSRIIVNDFSGLEKILRNSELLQACNEEVSSYTSGQETLLSALLYKLNNVCFKNKVCCLFLKYGLKKEEKIYKDLNLLDFLCSFRPGNESFPFVVQQTVFLVILFYNDETLTREAVKRCNTKREKEKILSFFIDKDGKFSTQYIYFPTHYVIYESSYQNFVLAFLEASLLLNRNVITEEPWDARVIFPLLEELASFLKRHSLSVENLSMRKKIILVGLVEALLLAGIHPLSYKKEYENSYINFFNKNKQVAYESAQIKKEVDFLLQKYWGWIFDKEERVEGKLLISGPEVFLGLFNECTGNYGSKISEVSRSIKTNDFGALEDLLKDKQAFNECTREVKSFSSKETCFSALLHTLKDAVHRHKVFMIFLKHGLSLKEIVFEDMNVLKFLCKLRGSIFLINTNTNLLLQTLCLGLFLLEDDSGLIEDVINNCCLEDGRRLKEFFFNKTAEKYSNKNLWLEEKIESSIYFLVKKAMLEASIIVNKNIMTNKPLNMPEINSWLECVVKSLSTLLVGFEKPLPNQENAINRRNRLLYIYEFLLVFIASYQFSFEEKKEAYSLLEQQLGKLKWRNKATKSFLLMLLQRHLEFVIKDSRKRKALTEVEAPEKKLRMPETSILIKNTDKLDLFYISREYGSKVENVLSFVITDDFSRLEEILKDPHLLEECNQEVSFLTNGSESLFSALIHKIKNPHTKHKICFLFLKYEFPKEEPVYKSLNLLSFLCSFRPGYWVAPDILMQTVFLAIFYYENSVLIESALKECKTLKEKNKIKSFFQDEEGNFSISSSNPISCLSECNDASWIFAFLEISLIKNKDITTGNPWTGDIIFLLLNKVMKLLCNKSGMSRSNKRRILTFLDLLEVLLLAGIHPNSYKEENREKYFSFVNQSFQYKNIKIQQEVSFLIRKYWGCFFNKEEPVVYRSIFLKTFGDYTMNSGKVTDEIS